MDLYLLNTIMNGIWYVFTIVFVLYRFTSFFSFIYNFTRFCTKLYNGVTYCCTIAYNYITRSPVHEDEESLLGHQRPRTSMFTSTTNYIKGVFKNVKERLTTKRPRYYGYGHYEEGMSSGYGNVNNTQYQNPWTTQSRSHLNKSTQSTQTEAGYESQYHYNKHQPADYYNSVSLFHAHDTHNLYENEDYTDALNYNGKNIANKDFPNEDLHTSIFNMPKQISPGGQKSALAFQIQSSRNGFIPVNDTQEIKELERLLASSYEVNKVIETEFFSKKKKSLDTLHSVSLHSQDNISNLPIESQVLKNPYI